MGKSSCWYQMVLGKSFNLSKPWFSLLQNGVINIKSLAGLLRELNGIRNICKVH